MTATLEKDSGTARLVLASFALGEAAAPGRVLVAPWGEVKSANGTFVIDAEAGGAIVEAFGAQGTDVPVDYEHQSLGGTYASPNGQAPAAGWIRSLELVAPDASDEPGLYANVEWTDAGAEKLAAKEYRYLSPVVIVRKRDRRVVALHSVALTNKPAIAGMRPIVNRADVDEAVEVLRMRLGLDAACGADAVMIAAAERIRALSDEADQRAAREVVAAAVAEGKLTPAQEAWAMQLALKDPACFAQWAATAPCVVTLGRTEAPEESGGGEAAVAASARAEYRSNPALAMLTSEEAYVGAASRLNVE